MTVCLSDPNNRNYMCNIPDLENLLADPCVFLFGAGASLDYNFPSWKGLYPMLMSKMSEGMNSRDVVKSTLSEY